MENTPSPTTTYRESAASDGSAGFDGPAGSGGPAGSRGPHGHGLLARFVHAAARSAARRPKTTVALWLALIVACVVLGSSAGMRTLSNAGSGTGESARADARLTASGLQGPATENVLVRSHSRQRTAHAVGALEAGLSRLPAVKLVNGPNRSPELSRAGGRTALVVVTLRGDPKNPDARAADVQHFVEGLAAREHGVSFYEAGSGSEDNAITQLVDNGLHRAELISIPITLVILVLAFGALVAASVPLLLGLTSVGAAIGALGLVSHIAPNGSSTAPVVVLIGLAVGVDYSLFYIRRERVERRNGASADAALAATSATVGRAILVAGMTVVIGLAGLLFTGFGVFTSMALGAILVVLIAVVGSLTVLPAMLALLGDRIDRGRLWPRRRRKRSRRRRTMWQALAAGVTNRPRTSLALAVVVLAGLAAPLISIQTGEPGEHDVSANTPIRVAADTIAREFPGSTDTADLVVSGHGLHHKQALAALRKIGRQGQQITGGRGAVAMQISRDGQTALLQIPMPESSLTVADHKVETIRHELEPAVASAIPGARADLTGDYAGNLDFTSRLSNVTPLVIAFVLGLAFILLIATFRSWRLALSVIGLNLLSVGAAFGVLVGVFQHHWAQSLLGFQSDGQVVDWLPLFAFVLLFGLSMDYTVLMLERAREARLAGASAREAAAVALGSTGGTVTSAALVMIAVFSVFATLPLLEFKQLGVGLAAAIALDATIVRGLALPAALTLLGDRGLAPARASRRRAQGWDHGVGVAAIGSTHD
ncbi:MAG TPA: MMPL family transporter [Solirubrobacteraceae bacterium]|nr:MMPL family transporter [Solirubrobacteraceae bacterium]